MRNLVLVLLALFFNKSDQQSDSLFDNYKIYDQLHEAINLQEKYARAYGQCLSYVQKMHSLDNQDEGNINTNKYKNINGGNFGNQKLDFVEDSNNRIGWNNYGTDSVSFPYVYPATPYTYYPYSYEGMQHMYPMNYPNGWKSNNFVRDVREHQPTAKDINNHTNWRFFDNDMCGETSSDRIIGGQQATLGQYPWLALIGYRLRSEEDVDQKTLFSCGGSLINSCWVLTAAHCVTNLPRTYYVHEIRLGEYDLNNEKDCDSMQCADPVQTFFPRKIIHHNQFNTPKQKHDVALIKLNKPAQFTNWVTPICLPRENLLFDNFVGKTGEVAGWGVNNVATRSTSKVLLFVKLTGTTIDKCQATFQSTDIDEESQICVGGVVGMDSCNGDSGGPLMKADAITGEPPKYYLFGVVSFGAKKCGAKPIPAVYSSVSFFLPWILNNIDEC